MEKIESLSASRLIPDASAERCDEGTTAQQTIPTPENVRSGKSEAASGPVIWKPPSRNGSEENLSLIGRQLQGNLNKLTIEKFETLAEKIAIQCESLSIYSHLQFAVDLILDKALLEPDWSEMYADLCQILFWRSNYYEVNGKHLSFASALLTKIQHEYESTPRNIDIDLSSKSDDQDIRIKRLRTKILGTVKMIGELFQRKMIGFKIVNKVVMDLVISNENPHEHLIECFLQLIYSTGYFIDQTPGLRPVLDMWFGRLKELMLRKGYSKRIKCVMQDVLDLPKAQWRKKLHKETAKALSDLREQINTEDILGGSALAAQFGNIVIVGERKNLCANCTYGGYMKRQEEIFKSRRGLCPEK